MKDLARIWIDDEGSISVAIDLDSPLTEDEYNELGLLLKRIVDNHIKAPERCNAEGQA